MKKHNWNKKENKNHILTPPPRFLYNAVWMDDCPFVAPNIENQELFLVDIFGLWIQWMFELGNQPRLLCSSLDELYEWRMRWEHTYQMLCTCNPLILINHGLQLKYFQIIMKVTLTVFF